MRGVDERTIESRLTSVTLPTAHRGGRLLIPLVDRVSTVLLSRRRYDATVSSAYGGLTPRSGRYIYDLVDDHKAGSEHAGRPDEGSKAEAYVQREIRAADQVTVSGLILADLVRTKYGRNAHVIPNGADVAAIRKATGEARGTGRSDTVSAVPVIAYIGGLDEFVRIDLLVRAVQRMRRAGIEAQVSIVGEGPALRGWSAPPWVKVLGLRMPEEIPSLLNRFRIGVVPFELSPFTHAALPLKVLEYGAARMLCVSVPLAELKRQALPWVILSELDEVRWADTLAQALNEPWKPAWDAVVERFDWSVSARRLAALALEA